MNVNISNAWTDIGTPIIVTVFTILIIVLVYRFSKKS